MLRKRSLISLVIRIKTTLSKHIECNTYTNVMYIQIYIFQQVHKYTTNLMSLIVSQFISKWDQHYENVNRLNPRTAIPSEALQQAEHNPGEEDTTMLQTRGSTGKLSRRYRRRRDADARDALTSRRRPPPYLPLPLFHPSYPVPDRTATVIIWPLIRESASSRQLARCTDVDNTIKFIISYKLFVKRSIYNWINSMKNYKPL